MKKIITRLFAIAVFAFSLNEWSGIVSPPIGYLANHSVGALLKELVKAPNAVYGAGDPYQGYVFLVLSIVVLFGFAAFARAISRYFDEAFARISILETELQLEFLDVEMTSARLSRNQLFHANRSGISAYKYTSSLDGANGIIELASVRMSSTLGNKPITKQPLHIIGSSKRIEVIEPYEKPLPVDYFASALPDSITRLLFKVGFFRHVVVCRSGDVIYTNEHNGDEAHLAVQSQYPTSHLVLTIRFPEQTAPDDIDVSCFLLNDYVVANVGYTRRHEGPYVVYRVETRNLGREQLRFQWSNRNLKIFTSRGSSSNRPRISLPFFSRRRP